MTEPIAPGPAEDKPTQNKGTDPGKPGESPQPSAPQPGGQAQPTFELPEKFKGKSAEDIAKSYLELEKKLGENASEIQKSKSELEEHRQLVGFIRNRPALAAAVKAEVEREIAQENGQRPQAPVRDDSRRFQEQQALSQFETRYGIDRLPSEKRKEILGQVGSEIVDMITIDGQPVKSAEEALMRIPLDRIPRVLEKAYSLVATRDREEKARSDAFVQARMNAEASWGTIPSSGSKAGDSKVTQAQQEAARRMGISDLSALDKYVE